MIGTNPAPALRRTFMIDAATASLTSAALLPATDPRADGTAIPRRS